MRNGENYRLKLLYMMQMFMEKTDSENHLTMTDILDYLASCAIFCERKSIYADIDELRKFGMEIIMVKRGGAAYYYLNKRDFDIAELKLLVDSVQSAKFITEKKSNELIKKLGKLTSKPQAKNLQRQVYIHGRVKTMNESIYKNVDKLHTAIGKDKQVRFKYFKWNTKKEPEFRHDGAWFTVSPWALIWDDEYYYLVAFDPVEEKIKHYRVDKMLKLSGTEKKREGKSLFDRFDLSSYSKKLFGMWGGEPVPVTMEAENNLVGVFIDRFGKDTTIYPTDSEHFGVKVEVVPSNQFFGWVMALGMGVKITKPASVVNMMRDYAKSIAEMY